MKCFRCGSFKMIKFIDGFGDRRIFCRKCSGSFLENMAFKQFNEQRSLREFNLDLYYKSRFQR